MRRKVSSWVGLSVCRCSSSLILRERSIAGLLAATVCSDHFESVLVVEPEGSPAELGMDKPKGMEFRTMEDGPNALPTPIPLRKRMVQYLALHGEMR